MRHRLIKGHAGHCKVDANQVLGVAPPQERGRARKGILEGKAARIFPRESHIYLIFRVFQCHDLSPFETIAPC